MLFPSFSFDKMLAEIRSLAHFTYQVYCNHAKSLNLCGGSPKLHSPLPIKLLIRNDCSIVGASDHFERLRAFYSHSSSLSLVSLLPKSFLKAQLPFSGIKSLERPQLVCYCQISSCFLIGPVSSQAAENGSSILARFNNVSNTYKCTKI